MSEPGERRRRRELERAGESGVPETAFGVSGDATPPSRRALRSQPIPSVGPDGQRGGTTPYQVPGLAPDTSQAMRSRRTIRDTPLDPTGPRPATTGQPSARPTSAGPQVPSAWSGHPSSSATSAPAQTYTSRPSTTRAAGAAGLPARSTESADGRPSQAVPPSSPAPSPAVPPAAARPAAARPAAARPAVARPSIVRPSTGAQPPSPYSAAAAPSAGPAQVSPPIQPPATGQATPPPAGFQPRSSAWGGQPGAGSTRPAAGDAGARSAAPAQSSRYGATPASTPPAPPAAPQAGWQPTSGRTGPSWAPSAGASDAVVPAPVVPAAYAAPVVGSWGAAAAAAAATPAPADATEVADEAPVPLWGSLGIAGSPPATRDEPVPSGTLYGDEDDEDDEERPSHPYTWLQLIVLALVAFVLGFLIVLLAGHGSADASDPAATPTPAASAQVDAGAPPVV
jgi:hypothetical protein